MGTATALANGGPLGLLLGYTIMGTICYSVMVSVACAYTSYFRSANPCPLSQISLGEMVAYLPIPGGHIKLAERFVDPALSFTMGWNYWYNWTIILPGELSAAAVLVNFWTTVGTFHVPLSAKLGSLFNGCKLFYRA